MICHDYKCLFVHIPKAAGMSIEHFFLDKVGLTWENRAPFLLGPNSDPAKGPGRLAHLFASEYVGLGHISQEVFDQYYKFSFVRNPWARLVSEYKFRNHHVFFTFKDFVEKHFPEPGQTDPYRHVVPQYDFLYSPEGKLLVDFVGKFENLQADFDQVASHLQIEDSALPHVNKTKKNSGYGPKWKLRRFLMSFKQKDHKSYVDYYDDALRDKVAKLYEKDIETFKYQFK